MHIRTVLKLSVVFVAFAGAVWLRSGERFSRPAMVEAMTRTCIIPGLRQLADSAAALSATANELQQNPSTNALAKAQQAWVDFQFVYKRNSMLGHGPAKDATYWTAMFFPQAMPTAVENVIRSPRPIEADFVEILGASAKGFYTLEYLLFNAPRGANIIGQTNKPARLSANLLLEGPTAERRRRYVRALARDLESSLRAAREEAQSATFIPKFVGGGQDTVNLLVNQVLDSVEREIVFPLNNYTNQMQLGHLRYDLIEGFNSGVSMASMKAALEGARNYYLGGDGMGIDDYIRNVNPDLDSRIQAQFKTASAALERIKEQIDQAIQRGDSSIDTALEESRKLELLIKVDAASALGVTVMFNLNDGD